MLKLGYNTNGFASHSLLSAIDIIGTLGYESIAITIDHHALDPWDRNLESQIAAVKKKLEKHQLSSIVETGARFLLDPWRKHEPTLISKGFKNKNYRITFIEKCISIASALGSHAVSIWSGKKNEDATESQAWDWLVSGCHILSKTAADHGVYLGFEPEPGMFVENLDQYKLLKKRVNNEFFKLTLDIGHAFITEPNVCESIRAYKNDIVNIHLEDMKKNKHEHLFFGEGDMVFKNIFNTLYEIEYSGQVNIELSRHSHNAVEIAENALGFANSIRVNSLS
jgi:sugar phosphate isomerase/epimerase